MWDVANLFIVWVAKPAHDLACIYLYSEPLGARPAPARSGTYGAQMLQLDFSELINRTCRSVSSAASSLLVVTQGSKVFSMRVVYERVGIDYSLATTIAYPELSNVD